MPEPAFRYRSYDEDSARWDGFPFRAGDIVISTRPKCGTTWMQMVCALLIFQTTQLPAPLPELSPWLDWLITPRERVFARLAAQPHRRFIKTHTPLDGIPLDPLASYIVVARHPLDAAVSLYYQNGNLNRERIHQLIGLPPPARQPRPPVSEWLLSWIHRDVEARETLESLPGMMWHLSDAWARRDQPNIELVHYDDLSADLEGEMRRLAAALGFSVPTSAWPDLVRAASFDSMRTAAARITPNPSGVMYDSRAFFRRGISGAGRELLTSDELDRYRVRAAQLAPAELVAWLHRETPDTPGGVTPPW